MWTNEKRGDTKITVQDWLDFLNSQKQTIMNSMAMDEGALISLGTLLIASIVSLVQSITLWILGVVGILFALYFIFRVSKRGRIKLLYIQGLINIQHEILKGELKEVKDISEKYFSLTLSLVKLSF